MPHLHPPRPATEMLSGAGSPGRVAGICTSSASRRVPRHDRAPATLASDGLVGAISSHGICLRVDDVTLKEPRPALRTQGCRLPDDKRLLHRYMVPQYKLGETSHTQGQERQGTRPVTMLPEKPWRGEGGAS